MPRQEPRTEQAPAQGYGSGSAAAVVAFALAQVGKPYVFGATGPGAYDCSGLMLAAFARVGVKMPRQSGAQSRMGRAVPASQARAGDLVVYPGHVGLVVAPGVMVDAGNPRVGVVRRKIYGSPSGYRRIVG